MMSSTRIFRTVVLALLAACCLGASVAPTLEDEFRSVPDRDKPWVYWWWLKGNVTEQSIARDLEAMKRNGIGGLLMFDARGYHEDHVIPPVSRMEFMSPEWRKMLKFALTEANRLALEVSVNLSSCAGALKGPWEVGDAAPKKLVWTSTEVPGPQHFQCDLRKPSGKRFWDVALLAVRHEQPDGASSTKPIGISGFSEQWQDVAPKLSVRSAAVEVINLSGKVDANGRLVWNAPEGRWTVLRFGCMTMDGHEFDLDILDPKAVEGHFDRMGKTLLKDAGSLAGTGRTLTHFYSVSWEGAAPTWTLALEKEFKKYRGYDLHPWLPVLAGVVVQNREVSERFVRDYYRTLGDCFMNNFYGTLHKLCGRAGLKWHSESGGPWDRKLAAFEQADQLAFLARNDMPQGEFWWPRRSMNRPAAMTAHTYGKRLAATEAFTHMQQHWSAYPATLKPRADAAFCDGINHLIWHTFTASPPELGLPGSEYFAGTHLNPNVTWWPQAGPFITYLGRNQFMLRQGHFVADVCCYVGDRAYLHWDQGTNWSAKSSLRLPKGYSYDLINTEVLLSRLSVKRGDLVLPDGMRYRLLVVDLDEPDVSPTALRKIFQLAKAGATVVLGQRQPMRAPGLADYPACDAEVRRLAAQLWGDAGPRPSSRAVRRGRIITGTAMKELLEAERIAPDFDGPWDFTHRHTDASEIYFVSGSGTADCTFRVKGQEPELWDPVTGRIRDAVAWRTTQDGRTAVPLTLPENGAVLVVFRKPAQPHHLVSAPAADREIVGRTTAGVQVRTWDKDQLALDGPWTVQFQPGRGAPESAVFSELTAWEKHTDSGIKHFSGSATYRKTFDLTESQAQQSIRLHLGEVKVIAQVRLNGQDLGVVWTDPWAVELTGTGKPGRNELEIVVVNTWVNRLIGDAGLPPEKRITKSNVSFQSGDRTFKVYQGFASKDPLMPSGLLGPVRLEFGRLESVAF